MLASIAEREQIQTLGVGVDRVGRGDCAVPNVASLSGDNVVATTGPLYGHDAFGLKLDNLWQFSFERPSSFFRECSSRFKRRKIAFQEKQSGIIRSHVEARLRTVSEGPHDTCESTLQAIAIVEKDLIHVSRGDCPEQEAKSSPMLREDSPRHGDIGREDRRFVRQVSLPNLHHQDLLNHEIVAPEIAQDVFGQGPATDKLPNSIREAHVTDNGSQGFVNLPNEESGSSWEFRVIASVKSQNRSFTSSDVIGSIAFERNNEYFATGGIARKIRVYSYSSLTSGLTQFVDNDVDGKEDEDEGEEDSTEYFKQRRLRKRRNSTADVDRTRCCVHEVCTPAKLSSIQWHQERPGLIACGDYDGVVTEWDVERSCAISERDENGGQRIWSIDYSKDSPDLIASASDDGSVHMWDQRSEQSVAVLSPPTYSSICCAEFGPRSSSHIALASADSNVYLYDSRWLGTPLLTLSSHKRAVSYVRFLNRHSLVSASIDSSVKLWDISNPQAAPPCPALPVKSFDSHHNVRNFTGLSVRGEGGLIACGSETNEAFVYESRRSSPVLTHSFEYKVGAGFGQSNPNRAAPVTGVRLHSQGVSLKPPEGGAAATGLMVSAVCWRVEPGDCSLVAANSDGALRILSGRAHG